jgi:peptide/nickel transport system permease protein
MRLRGRITRFGPAVACAWAILVLVTLAAVFAAEIAPYDPVAMDLSDRLLPPAFAPGGDPGHLLGTDALGRDILSRIMYGGRVSISVGVGAVLLAGSSGVLLGAAAGYYGGLLDTVIMRLADVFLAIPFLLLGMAVVATLGPSVINLILVLGAVRWTTYGRVIRGEALSVREKEYVHAARACGASGRRIVFRHVLPNVVNPVVVIATLEIANMIIYESALSFFGLGVKPPQPTWGNMLSDGRDYIHTAWWLTTLPGFVIFVTVLALNIVGDWLRDVLDPRLSLDV